MYGFNAVIGIVIFCEKRDVLSSSHFLTSSTLHNDLSLCSCITRWKYSLKSLFGMAFANASRSKQIHRAHRFGMRRSATNRSSASRRVLTLASGRALPPPSLLRMSLNRFKCHWDVLEVARPLAGDLILIDETHPHASVWEWFLISDFFYSSML